MPRSKIIMKQQSVRCLAWLMGRGRPTTPYSTGDLDVANQDGDCRITTTRQSCSRCDHSIVARVRFEGTRQISAGRSRFAGPNRFRTNASTILVHCPVAVHAPPKVRPTPLVSQGSNGARPNRQTSFFPSGSASFSRRSLRRKLFAPTAKANRVRRTAYGTRISACG